MSDLNLWLQKPDIYSFEFRGKEMFFRAPDEVVVFLQNLGDIELHKSPEIVAELMIQCACDSEGDLILNKENKDTLLASDGLIFAFLPALQKGAMDRVEAMNKSADSFKKK